MINEALRISRLTVDGARRFGRGTPLTKAPAGLKPVMGDPDLPLLGATLRYRADPLGLAQAKVAKYGEIYWTDLWAHRWVAVLSPEGQSEVLHDRNHIFSSDSWEYLIGPFFRRGLMLLNFDEHRHHRLIMQEAFTRPRMAGYLEIMGPAISKSFESWVPNDHLLAYPAIKQFELDLASAVFLDTDLGSRADAINKAFVDTVRGGATPVRAPVPGGLWRAGLEGRKVLEDFFRSELPTKRRSQGNDLFSALTHAKDENGKSFSDDDVVNHMCFLLMAAHDTSTISLSSMLYQMAKHPEWQEAARDEALALDKDHVEIADLDQLPVIDRIFMEAIRLITPVPGVARMATEETEIQGFHIPKGQFVSVGLGFPHFNERFWTRPMEFDPDRFSPDRAEHRSHPYAYVPFGGGAHKCIGMRFAHMQVAAFMHQFLRRFRWSVPHDYELEWDHTSLPVPADQLPIKLEKL